MAKLQHTFVQGKMNKDLDERLVPNGQYRDAQNIQISSSEGSDVGAVETILGNTKQNKKTSSLSWGANFGLTSPKCIGGFKDTLNNKIYWFITATNGDAILEYDQDNNGFVAPVILDTRGTSVLNFNASYRITGINILDDMLFWTDNYNEPRKINITDYKTATAASVGSSATILAGTSKTTAIYSRPFLASDITVIKPSPKQAVAITAVPTGKNTQGYDADSEGLIPFLGTGILPIQISANFTDSNNFVLKNGDTISLGWSQSQAVGPVSEFNNKKVVLTHDAERTDGTKIRYEVIGTLSNLQGITGPGSQTYATNATLTIISSAPDIPSTTLEWDMILLEDEPIFKNNFPRFSYRWKYVDGEYSTYAPFSKAAFVPGEFYYDPEEGYNLGMDDNIRKITLTFPSQAYATPPKDVVEIQILYKGVDSNNIYVLDKHKTASGTLSTFVITKDLLGPVVESLQLLRLYDNVPRKAQAQEIIGNRVVYGNYLHNYPFDDTGFAITGSSTATALTSDEKYKGYESVKTERTYQIGVAFLDEFNRESPVFTTKGAAIKINSEDADKKNILRASASVTNAPTWAEYYKYYVKDPSPEYYNIVLDRYYFSNDGNVWLSFPSSERNKVAEGDYIILKKQHGSNNSVYINNKYKVLDIKNEAPDFIKRTNQATTISEITIEDVSADVAGKVLKFTGPTPKDSETFVNALKGGNSIQFRSLDNVKTSDVYRIANGGPIGDAHQTNKVYKVELANGKGLSTNDVWIQNLSDGDEIEALIYDRTSELLPEFQGKFFVKVPQTRTFDNDIASGQREEEYVNVLRFATGITANIAVSAGSAEQSLAYGGVSSDTSANAAHQGPDDGQATFKLNVFLELLDGSDPSNSKIFPDRDALKTYEEVKIGAKIRFKNSSGDEGQTYIVTNITNATLYTYVVSGITYTFQRKTVTVDRTFDDNLGVDPSELQIVETSLGDVNAVSNPGIFETEPNELADLDIYYEASNALEIGNNAANLGNTVTLDFKNCYTFGNGVESNRIRDDFNAPQKGKGVRVSTVLQTPYYEERLPASLIYSGIVNSRSGINNSNQFTTAIDITKDLPNTYGGIQKLHARDTDLIALCEDKCFRILANKDALFNADGNTNVTSNKNVLGQAVPYVGEFGISKNPESFASYGFRTYFTDKARGAVIRLSRDGITEISNKGMTDYFEDGLKSTTSALIGSYDEHNGSYNVRIGTEQVSFKETVDGWATRLSYEPEFAISLNNDYYSFKNGEIWEHSSNTRSNFYGTQESTTIKPVFNDAPTSVKNFKTLSYEGAEGWTATVVTNKQSGTVTTWKEREGMYFNYIMGDATTLANIDTKEFSVQGIGNVLTHPAANTIIINGEINTSLQPGDIIYSPNGVTSPAVLRVIGTVASISRPNQITLVSNAPSPAPAPGNFMLFAKDSQVNTSGLLGYYADIEFSITSSNKKELFAVNSEIFISSE